jgi:hypothetical protein
VDAPTDLDAVRFVRGLLSLVFTKGFEQKTAALLASYDRTPPAELVARDRNNFVATPARLAEEGSSPPWSSSAARRPRGSSSRTPSGAR